MEIAIDYPDGSNNQTYRFNVALHPTQLYEAGAEAIILFVLLATESRGRRFSGRTPGASASRSTIRRSSHSLRR
jgi:prolipoprotein diacylglyceryltransferase